MPVINVCRRCTRVHGFPATAHRFLPCDCMPARRENGCNGTRLTERMDEAVQDGVDFFFGSGPVYAGAPPCAGGS